MIAIFIRTQNLYYYPQRPSWAPFVFLVSPLILAAVSLAELKVGEGGDCLLLLLAATLDWIMEVVYTAKARLLKASWATPFSVSLKPAFLTQEPVLQNPVFNRLLLVSMEIVTGGCPSFPQPPGIIGMSTFTILSNTSHIQGHQK